MNLYFEKDLRYYRIRLQQDLFGDWIVERIFGRKESKIGQKRQQVFHNKSDAERYCQRLIKQRLHSRHYKVIAEREYLVERA